MTMIFIKTYGCALNQSDSEAMAGILESKGHRVAESIDDAELVIINTCTVKDNTEKRFWSELAGIPKSKKVVVAGCIPQSDPNNAKLKDYSLVGTAQISNITAAVEETLRGRVVRMLSWENEERAGFPKKRKNRFVEIIPLSAGCLGSCTYCKTKQARGDLISYPPDKIKKQFCSAVNEGIKEIWLTSQDTGAYGFDIKTDLAELLDELLRTKGDYRIRIGMMNPNHLLRIKEKLIPIMKKSDNIYKFLHIPLQSGSSRVLKDMNRFYTAENFISLIDFVRKEMPGITIATDVICGYPTETEEDFEMTLSLCDRIGFDAVNISRFCGRKGTRAALLKKHTTQTLKQRTKKMAEQVKNKSLAANKAWVGWKGKAYFYEAGKDGTIIGKNIFYKQVVVKGDRSLLGRELKVEIEDAGVYDLKGKIVK